MPSMSGINRAILSEAALLTEHKIGLDIQMLVPKQKDGVLLLAQGGYTGSITQTTER